MAMRERKKVGEMVSSGLNNPKSMEMNKQVLSDISPSNGCRTDTLTPQCEIQRRKHRYYYITQVKVNVSSTKPMRTLPSLLELHQHVLLTYPQEKVRKFGNQVLSLRRKQHRKG